METGRMPVLRAEANIRQHPCATPRLQHARQRRLAVRRKRVAQGLFFPRTRGEHPHLPGRRNRCVPQRNTVGRGFGGTGGKTARRS